MSNQYKAIFGSDEPLALGQVNPRSCDNRRSISALIPSFRASYHDRQIIYRLPVAMFCRSTGHHCTAPNGNFGHAYLQKNDQHRRSRFASCSWRTTSRVTAAHAIS